MAKRGAGHEVDLLLNFIHQNIFNVINDDFINPSSALMRMNEQICDLNRRDAEIAQFFKDFLRVRCDSPWHRLPGQVCGETLKRSNLN